MDSAPSYGKSRSRGAITMMSVVGYINERPRSDTVNKEVTLLSSIFIMAIRERVAHSNPRNELLKSVRSKIPARRKREEDHGCQEGLHLGLIGGRD